MAALEAAGGGPELPRIPINDRQVAWEIRVAAAIDRGDREAADAAAAEAERWAKRSGLRGIAGFAARCRARAELEWGAPDTAAGAAAASAAAFDQLGAPFDAARSRLLEGKCLAAAGRRDEGVRVLKDAEQILHDLGAERFRAEAAARSGGAGAARRCGPPPRPAPCPPPVHARLGRRKHGARGAERARARDRRTHPPPAHQPRDRRQALHLRQDRSDPHSQHLPQARRQLARRRGRSTRTGGRRAQRLTRRRTAGRWARPGRQAREPVRRFWWRHPDPGQRGRARLRVSRPGSWISNHPDAGRAARRQAGVDATHRQPIA